MPAQSQSRARDEVGARTGPARVHGGRGGRRPGRTGRGGQRRPAWAPGHPVRGQRVRRGPVRPGAAHSGQRGIQRDGPVLLDDAGQARRRGPAGHPGGCGRSGRLRPRGARHRRRPAPAGHPRHRPSQGADLRRGDHRRQAGRQDGGRHWRRRHRLRRMRTAGHRRVADAEPQGVEGGVGGGRSAGGSGRAEHAPARPGGPAGVPAAADQGSAGQAARQDHRLGAPGVVAGQRRAPACPGSITSGSTTTACTSASDRTGNGRSRWRWIRWWCAPARSRCATWPTTYAVRAWIRTLSAGRRWPPNWMPSVRSSRAPNSPPSSDAEFVRPVRLALRLNPDTTRHCTAFATEATVAVAIHLYGWIGGLDNRTLTQGCGTMRAGGRRGRSWRDPAAVTAALDALGISSANIAEHRSMRRQAVHVVARHCRLPRTDRAPARYPAHSTSERHRRPSNSCPRGHPFGACP